MRRRTEFPGAAIEVANDESMNDERHRAASDLMVQFAEATGLVGEAPPRRYLWTDAFAICNLLELYTETAERRFLDLAMALVDQVHSVLGKHRPDDSRRGWISGLDETEGRAHPTRGGLRIGKPLPERQPHEPHDAVLEWDQDGQYYHYLTKWMHALHRMAAVTGEVQYRDWAVDLALATHRGFRAPTGPPRLYWKASIDLTRPLVASSGLHDPLDGLVTGLVLGAAGNNQEAALADVNAELVASCREGRWATTDPLGIGGLLFDACRLAQLSIRPDSLLTTVLGAAESSLETFARGRPLAAPATHRLAFRELGLSIGLHGIDSMRAMRLPDSTRRQLARFTGYATLAGAVEDFWLMPAHRLNSWREHADINGVMLATSLAPGQFLSARWWAATERD